MWNEKNKNENLFVFVSHLAHNFAEHPRVENVDLDRHRYRDQYQEEVTDCETDDEDVRLGSHPFVSKNGEDERGISDQSDNVDDDEEQRHDDPQHLGSDLALGVRFLTRVERCEVSISARIRTVITALAKTGMNSQTTPKI